MQIIVFTGGEATKPRLAETYFNEHFEFIKKPSLVIAADSGLESLRAYQEYFKNQIDLSPSIILGDFDSISDKKTLKEYEPKIIQEHSSYKDFTDTELALKEAQEFIKAQNNSDKKKAFITLIGGQGGRADHFLGIYNLFGTKISPDAWLCGEQILYKAEKKVFFIGGLKAGDTISIARTSKKDSGGKINSQGLEWESPSFRNKGMPSISNTIKAEYEQKNIPVKINFLKGSFVLFLPLFASVRLSEDNKEK